MMDQNLQAQNETFGPWIKAGVHDNVVADFLKRKILKEHNSILFFELFCLIVSLVALFASLLFAPVYATIVITVLAGVLVYLVIEKNRERKIILSYIDQKQYQISEVEVFDFDANKAVKKCFVRDRSGNPFVDPTQKQSNQTAVTYHSYFSDKETRAVLIRMKKGSKGMYYIVLPESYLRS